MKRGIPIYSEEILFTMRYHYAQLPERTRRQYAAVEACKLGYGGISYISRVLDIDRTTIYKGRKELSCLQGTLASGRQRKEGGGRKKRQPGVNYA